MSKAASPEPRWGYESALTGDELHLFGGITEKYKYKYYFSRNEIWTYNVQEEKKWIRRFTEGKITPPPCAGARCINGIIYSYGGEKKDGGDLGEVFGLDPKKMKWILVATPIHVKKPWQRRSCCLWAIGGRIIMFGGYSWDFPQDRLRSGTQWNRGVNNEIYEFVFEEGRENGKFHELKIGNNLNVDN